MIRFTCVKKAALVQKYLDGIDISLIMADNFISHEEMVGWVNRYSEYGLKGLRPGHFRDVRKSEHF